MATLRNIRRRIVAVSNTAKITQAMRMVSAAKLRRAQEAAWSARPYFSKMEEMLSNLVESVGDDYTNPLLEKRKEVKNIAAVIVASDRGLCGSFNTNILRFATRIIAEEFPKQFPGAKVHMILVGRKSISNYKVENAVIFKKFPGIFQPLKFSAAKEIIEDVKTGFVEGKFDKVVVFYNFFRNLISQVPSMINLLPIEPKKGIKVQEKYNIDYIFEPNRTTIIEELLPKHLDIQVWKTLLESNAAEQAARMMAMENATRNANDLVKHLGLVYNKERQAAITKEMLEIVGGSNALRKA